jgi:hypothetical protein
MLDNVRVGVYIYDIRKEKKRGKMESKRYKTSKRGRLKGKRVHEGCL